MSLLAREYGVSEQVAGLGAEWLPGEQLSRHTSLAVGGPADIIRVHDAHRLPELVGYLHQRGVPGESWAAARTCWWRTKDCRMSCFVWHAARRCRLRETASRRLLRQTWAPRFSNVLNGTWGAWKA